MASDDSTVGDITPRGPDTASGARAASTASTIRVTGFVGVVSPFDGNQEEWAEYAERLEHYFTANDIVDIAKRRAILLNGVGAPTYRAGQSRDFDKWAPPPRRFTCEFRFCSRGFKRFRG